MIRPATLLIALLAVSLSLTMFMVKYQVQDMEDQLLGLNRSITDDRQAIHVLKAEWSYLNEPSRLKILAERYLGMTAIDSRQVGTARELLPPIHQDNAETVTPLTASVVIQEQPR